MNKLNLQHLFSMTDCTGIIQHAKYSVPDLITGYTTDDNARALIIACRLYEKSPCQEFFSLISRYLAFLDFGQNPDGKWRNFMNYQRQFIEPEGSEDSFGRSVWALGHTSNTDSLPSGYRDIASFMAENALVNLEHLQSLRAICYSLIGLVHLYNANVNFVEESTIASTAERVLTLYKENKTSDWHWFENIITYANGIVPYSLLMAFTVLDEKEYFETAIELLNFLETFTMQNSYLKLIGCNGWAIKGHAPSEFDEQPIDAADMVLAYSQAYNITNKDEYLQKTKICFDWFHGLNCHNISLINPENGGCYDGLTEDGVNLNQGAESTFSYINSYLIAENMGLV